MIEIFDQVELRGIAMLKLSLEAIELVDAIDRYGSFAAASVRLHKVPSTISYAINKLEEQLGLALFLRQGQRVHLTAAGRELLKEGRWLVIAAAELESRLRQIATGFESEFRLVVGVFGGGLAMLRSVLAGVVVSFTLWCVSQCGVVWFFVLCVCG